MRDSSDEEAGMEHENIVVGLDHSPAGEAALNWALEEAAGCGASVRVVSTFP